MRRDPTDSRQTQRGRILALLLAQRGGEVGLPEILSLRISQFGARILELRGLGFAILNRVEIVNGEKRSWYRLEAGPPPTAPTPPPPVVGGSLFGDLSLRHRDDN